MDAIAQLANALAGRYTVEAEVGRGGMATVYRARDLKHARHVALKVLSPELGAILGVERFLSEIRVTANLQHPNLLPLFDSGEADGLLFYVMPFVEGETLRHRLEREKQLPIEEAVRIAAAIANALDYAHRHGVIHRDLKPENVLLQDGQPLLADFGIALAVANAGGTRVTQTGLSLGTPQYMSPEQATGDHNIDGRTDIYSLAAVTYEMLTGDPPHSGTTAQAIIARLMTEDPRPIASSRRSVPDYLDAAVARGLEKLPADRFQTAREFGDALQGHGVTISRDRGTQVAAGARRANRVRRWLVPAAVGLVSAAAAFVIAYRARPTAPPFPPTRFEFSAPAGVTAVAYGTGVALSPDGRWIVFTGVARGQQLYSRAIGELDAKPIPGTEGGTQPVFSPDGRWIAFTTRAGLQKVEATGGAPVTLATIRLRNGLDWTEDGIIVAGASPPHNGLLRLPDAGGPLVELTTPDTAHGVVEHVFPIVLADGKTIVFAMYDGKSIRGSRLAMTSLADGTVHPLDVAGMTPLGVVEGQLVYVRADGAVMAAPLDIGARRVTGGSVPVMEPVSICPSCNGDAAVRLSRGGSLVALRGSSMSRLVVLDRAGGERAISHEDRDFVQPSFSPDGRRLAVSVGGTDSVHNRDIWIYDVATSSPMRLTSGKDNFNPRWTPDGRRILFAAGDHRNPRQVWAQAADGSSPAERIEEAPEAVTADLAPNGRSLVFGLGDGNPRQIQTVTLGSGAKATTFAHDGASSSPRFSPDGRWVAYSSDESGRSEIYVRPYPGPGGRVQLSVNGGSVARWIDGGRALVYESAQGVLEVAAVATSPAFTVQSRTPFFAGAAPPLELSRGADVSSDGRYVAVVKPSGDGMKVLVVVNWAQELRDRLRR
jgi:tRNA A-37 threonylcarbamoyl transferase component Bud32